MTQISKVNLNRVQCVITCRILRHIPCAQWCRPKFGAKENESHVVARWSHVMRRISTSSSLVRTQEVARIVGELSPRLQREPWTSLQPSSQLATLLISEAGNLTFQARPSLDWPRMCIAWINYLGLRIPGNMSRLRSFLTYPSSSFMFATAGREDSNYRNCLSCKKRCVTWCCCSLCLLRRF